MLPFGLLFSLLTGRNTSSPSNIKIGGNIIKRKDPSEDDSRNANKRRNNIWEQWTRSADSGPIRSALQEWQTTLATVISEGDSHPERVNLENLRVFCCYFRFL